TERKISRTGFAPADYTTHRDAPDLHELKIKKFQFYTLYSLSCFFVALRFCDFARAILSQNTCTSS
ncbi:MAG: hypothetical protein K8S23_16015, partial [Candidatus Cloacimonetes bacterium]|nr:hypothetical protein [Candidatus Cloacimonadota bacterium]